MTSASSSNSYDDQAHGLVVLFSSKGAHSLSGAEQAIELTGERPESLEALRHPQACDYLRAWLEAHRLGKLSCPRIDRNPYTTPAICHEETFEKIHGRMRNFHGLTGLGTTLPCPVDELSAYPHVGKSQGYMGKAGRNLNHFSPVRPPQKSRYRRNTSIFPSIPNPYYDD